VGLWALCRDNAPSAPTPPPTQGGHGGVGVVCRKGIMFLFDSRRERETIPYQRKLS